MFNIVTEESFDLNNSVQNILSIQVSLDGFSFSVAPFERAENIIAYGTYPKAEGMLSENLEQFLVSHELFKRQFHKTIVLPFLPGFSLIPEQFYASGCKKNEIASKQVSKEASERFSVKVSSQNSRLCFEVPNDIHGILSEKLQKFEYVHPAQLIVDHLAESNSTGLTLLYGNSVVYIIVYQSNRLLACNSYIIENNDDVLYHTLNILTQLNLNSKDVDFHYLESLERNRKLENAIKPFFTRNRRYGEFRLPDSQESYRESLHFCLY